MKLTVKRMEIYLVFTLCVAGCYTGSRVTIAPRSVPEYPKALQHVPEGVKVVVYPAAVSGDSESRALRRMGHAQLEESLRAIGYDVVSPERSCAGCDVGCIVELVDSRHDMPERATGNMVSIVTVVAVRVRKPGVMRNGNIDCGRSRSFQGVYRMALGQRPFDFRMTEEERENGIKGAVGNLVGSVQFHDAIVQAARN